MTAGDAPTVPPTTERWSGGSSDPARMCPAGYVSFRSGRRSREFIQHSFEKHRFQPMTASSLAHDLAYRDFPARPAVPSAAGLRVALFSGNYNCVRDGANRALNRLVAHLIARGAAVRVYSPTAPVPAFLPAGDLVSVPSVGIPSRSEYRVALGLPASIRRDIAAFAPTHFHV